MHLRGPVKIAKGETPALVYNLDNDLAFGFFFDVWSLSPGEDRKYYVAVRNPGQKDSEPIEAHLKSAGLVRNPNSNTFIISEALAGNLGIQSGQDIVITQVYLKPEDVNLDEI